MEQVLLTTAKAANNTAGKVCAAAQFGFALVFLNTIADLQGTILVA